MDGISPRYSGLLEQYSSLPEKKKKIVRLFLEKEGVDFFNLPIFPGNGKNDDFPLSSTQQGMWFLDRLAPRNPFYNVPLCFYLEGPLDAGILRKSVDRVVQRHEVLRTSFPTVDGKPAPRIESGLMWNIRVRDGSHLPEAEWRRRVAEMADEEAMRPFDLDEAPLFRVVLYRYNEQKHFFQWTFHHMVIDGWSIGVLLRELSSWFARFAGAGGEKPPELTVQYADFAAWQRAALEGAHVQAQLRYWEKRLQHAETLSLPLDHPRPAVQTYRGEAIMFRFPKPRNQGLEKLREREGASLFMVLLAVFKLLLSGYSGQENIVVGTPTANRGRKELENLIGFFSNSLALSTDLSGDPDFSQLAARVKKGVLEDFANQDAPFERVVERLGVERDPSKSALFQVLFVLQNFTLDEFTLPGLTAAPHSLNFATTHFDLELHFWDEKDHLKGALFYNVDLFERETMVRLHSDYQDLLQRAAADPDQPVSSLLKEIAGREKWRRPRLHLADLLPGWRRFETSEEPIDADGSDVSGPRVDPAAYKGPMALSAGPPLTIPEDAPETLTEALIRSADDGSKGVVCVQERGARVFLSYAEILADAKSILAGLQARGCGPGDRMILQIGRLQDHFSAFWACALGGVIPVTVAVSPAFDRRNSVVNKLWNIWDLLSHPPILTNEGLAEDLAGVPSLYPDHPAAAENRFEVLSIESLRRDASDARLHPCKPDDVIFYQLTSGSTGVPKCIQETHRGIIHHIHGSREWNGYTPEDVTLNWLPMDHVVPILTIHLKDVYMGIREVHVKTDLVLREPLLWLDLMASEGVTHTWAPNFGFKLVSDRLADQRNGRGDGRGDGQWDLSRLKFCMNAGEQVTLPVVEEFLERTAPLGVRPRVMQPSFGMAEACTCMTYLNDFDVASGVHRVSKASLGGVLEESGDPKNAIDFVDLGKPMHGVEIRITDDRNRLLPESVIGRFQIKGRVITPGYYKNDKANQEAFVGDDWFNSGDLGFIKNGSLTLTGREKEMINVRGANFYCYEIEDIVNQIEDVAPTFVAACAVDSPSAGTEGLAIFFVPKDPGWFSDPDGWAPLLRTITGNVAMDLGTSPTFVLPISKAEFPKTTSGKIQRTQLRKKLAAGGFEPLIQRTELALESENTLPNWFFRPAWREKSAPAAPTPVRRPGGRDLIFADPLGLGLRLKEQGGPEKAVLVEMGPGFRKKGSDHYTLTPGEPDHYRRLFSDMADDGIRIGRVIHLFTYDRRPDSVPRESALEEALEKGVYSLLFFSRAFEERDHGVVPLYVVSAGAQGVDRDHDRRIAWERAPINGLIRTISQEIPALDCFHLDLPIPRRSDRDRSARDAALVRREIRGDAGDREVVFRGGARLIPRLERVDFSSPGEPPFQHKGLILISGGLGGVGIHLSEWLLERFQARLLLMGRTPRERLDPEKARALRELEKGKGEVTYAAADICDFKRVQAAARQAEERWGRPLGGVIHLAGIFKTRLLREETRDSFAETLRPKLHGTLALDRLLEEGFFIHFGSVNGLLGGVAAGAYAAANAFPGAFARRRGEKRRDYCLSWSTWDEVGMSRGFMLKEQSRAQGFYALSPARGLHSLLAALARGPGHLVVGLDREGPLVRSYGKETPRREGRALTGRPPAADAAEGAGEGAGPPDGAPRGPAVASAADLEKKIASIWKRILQKERVEVDQNFFHLGGNSVLIVQALSQLEPLVDRELTVVDLLRYPTIRALVQFLAPDRPEAPAPSPEPHPGRPPGPVPGPEARLQPGENEGPAPISAPTPARVSAPEPVPEPFPEPVPGPIPEPAPAGPTARPSADVAIIGMAGRFPKARNLREFWQNLKEGRECVSFFSPGELSEAGVTPEEQRAENFVNARAIIEDADCFDAAFFGFTPREAEMTDPQQRLFLECAWEALENAGCNPDAYPGRIGVYAGSDVNYYALSNFFADHPIMQTLIGNDKDYLATRAAYKMNLRGPAISVQTACSTSLVAIQLACQALLSDQADAALAGGAGIAFPQKAGYVYEPGHILSPDGRCRAFDARARGTVCGDGVGVVLLKRMADAVRDGDHIHAIIKGAAINNDGAEKVGFTAPGIEGQISVIAAAQETAGIDPGTIGYIEAHGTGTDLGDPMEITALTEVFRAGTEKKGFCAIGSLKSNVGHMNSAAGVGSLIKTVLALQNRMIPPSLHYETPNPKIDFANSPFYVSNRLEIWKKQGGAPRRAGVSSFGVGGTNAHVILEEAPSREKAPPAPGRPWLPFMLSARTAPALETAADNLARHFRANPGVDPADAAYTLWEGRKRLPHRRVVICRDLADAAAALETGDPKRVFSAPGELGDGKAVFLFPGQGSQYVQMGKELYATEPLFQQNLDRCAELLLPHLGVDPRDILYPRDLFDKDREAEAAEKLTRTEWTQPILVAFEYALARLWISWGVAPAGMIGHSIGEYAAACISGVFSLEDALALAALRGRLMGGLPRGAMVAAPLTEEEARALPGMEIAAVNAPGMRVLSGTEAEAGEVEALLKSRGVPSRRLHTSHAFHSRMMDPILAEFRAAVREVALHPPRVPFISNATGDFITNEEAADPEYWVGQIRKPVLFSRGVAKLLEAPGRALLEVGPGRVLGGLARKHPEKTGGRLILNSVRDPREKGSDARCLMTALGRAALHGVSIHWPRLHAGEKRRRVPLPGYPFERERYWTPPLKPPIKRSDAPAPPRGARASAPDLFSRDPDPGRWLYAPSWKRAVPAAPAATGSGARRDGCLVFTDRDDWGAEMKSRLREMYRELICVYPAHDYAASGRREYALNPGGREGYVQLVRELANQGRLPGSVIHLWSLADSESADRAREKGFYSLLYFCQALAEEKYFDSPGDSMEIRVVTRGMFDVTGEEALDPGRATLRGVCQVVSQEQPRIRFRIIDVCETGAKNRTSVIEQIFRELHSGRSEPATALRGRGRWVEHHEALREETASNGIGFREKGVYWITGGWGRIGFALAKHLARNHGARLALTGRRPGPGALVETLASLGAETLDLQADVADEEQMARALEEIRRRFGAPDGVIHAAGVVEPSHLFKAFQQTDPDHCRRHFDPKIRGVRVLEKLLPRETDFVVLFSSLSTVLGGVGFTAYAAGNHFLDAFAVSRARKGRSPWISISWPGWRFTGDPGPFDIRPDEGIDVLERILSSHGRLPQIVVSTTDLRARIENPLQLAEAAAKKGAAKKGAPDKSALEKGAPDKSAPGKAPRGAGEDPGPRNEIEEALVEIWKELLGYRTIRVDDNFFELGGDSLMAIALAERIRQRFSMEISVHNLFDAPTIADLAGKIEPSASPSPRGAPPAEVDLPGRAPREKASRKYDSKSWSPLALIKTSGSAPPFFCASAAFGSAFPFYRLAMHLEEDQPFYGLQCPGMDGERPPLETIEELADLYLKAIRTVQPRGPYFLGGYSFGGWVAYEMARRLAKEGEAPALLAIVGAGLPPEMGKPPSFDVRSDDFMARVDQMSESFLDAFLSRGQRERSHLLQVVKANNRASFLYRPRPYAGAMNLFLTGEFLSQTPDASLGWSILCRGEVVSHLVSGNHISTLHEPHVADLAGKLTFVLNKEQKKR